MTLFKKNKIFSLFLVLALVFTMLPTAAFAAEATEDEHIHTEECVHETGEEDIEIESEATDTNSGMIGESNLAWSFDPSTGMLKISGSGGCEAFTSAEDQPWKHLREQIKEVWFYDVEQLAIENLAYWFEGCTALVTAELPYTTFVIGENAFADCTSLRRVLMYYMETPPVIADGAFYVDELTMLEVLYIPMAETANEVVHTRDWRAENRAVYFSDVYGMMTLASGYCPYCKGTYSYTLSYEYWTENIHSIRHWCSNCGLDQCEGGNAANHSYNNSGTCTYCGHYNSSYDNSVCYHTSTTTSWSGCNWTKYCRSCGAYVNSGTSHGSTYTEWSGCNWYEYCRDCGQLMDYGTSHGSYSYGAWQYYSSSQHRRLYSCSDCGQGSYSYGYHSTSTQYSQYSSTQHKKGSYCSTCGSYVGSTSYESHSFSYGSWSNYSSSQHRRTKTCSSCGYSTYEYANHSLIYGDWTVCEGDDYSTQHKRTVSCSCGYSITEYEEHDCYADGEWKYSDSTFHTRHEKCDCGYKRNLYTHHSYTTTRESVSDTEHRVVRYCSACEHTETTTEAHDLTHGEWSPYDEEQHKRVNACDCGYSADEYGAHEDRDGDDYCDSCDYLMSRFSVTVPATLNLTVAKDGTVYAATTAQIVNNSTDTVSVTSIQLNTENGWQLVPYSTNMANAKVDARLIGFCLNGAESDGTENLPMSQNWQIAKDDALTLDYDAVVSATSDPINEQVLTIVFVLDWAK